MDGQQFDRLTQQLGRALTRRRVGGLAAALGIAAGLGARDGAKLKAKKKKKKKAKPCAAGTVRCGTACVNPQTDSANCGRCGNRCGTGQACAGGQCQGGGGGCPGGQVSCGGGCVDPRSDEAHCGGCGTACQGDLTCLNGQCGCAAGTRCGTECVDTQSNAQHCGGCGNACQGALTCISGQCGCAAGTTCGNRCVDTQTDDAHCGSCGNGCTSGKRCQGGQCVDQPECTSQAQCGGSGSNHLVCRNGRCLCPQGQGLCHRFPDGRGTCHVCCPGGSGQCPGNRTLGEVCHYYQTSSGTWAGMCNCPTGWDRCQPSGVCVGDTDTDPRHCGPSCTDCQNDQTVNPKGICCNGQCHEGCSPGTTCLGLNGPCGPNCNRCGEGSICCNMGPGTAPRCIPNVNGRCYLN
jgi:hypothetical protein